MTSTFITGAHQTLPRRAGPAAATTAGPRCASPNYGKQGGEKKKYNYFGITCLIGIARPLPMLSVLLSRTFFSLSGSLPFRDCRAKRKVCAPLNAHRGCFFLPFFCLFFLGGQLKKIWQVNLGSKAAGWIYTSM